MVVEVLLVLVGLSFGGEASERRVPVAPKILPRDLRFETNEGGKVLLVLPAASPEVVTWGLYMSTCETAIGEGRLSGSVVFHRVKLPKIESCSCAAVLVLKDADGRIVDMDSCKVMVEDNSHVNWWERIGAPLVGAVIAVGVFVIKKAIDDRRQRGEERARLAARIAAVMDALEPRSGKPSDIAELPSWLIDSSSQEWQPELRREPFRTIISEIETIRKRASAGTLYDQALRDALDELKRRLP
jgi:hypothetical protein